MSLKPFGSQRAEGLPRPSGPRPPYFSNLLCEIFNEIGLWVFLNTWPFLRDQRLILRLVFYVLPGSQLTKLS